MKIILTAVLWMVCASCFAQSFKQMEQAVEAALKNNLRIKSARDKSTAVRELQKTSIDLPKTEAILMYGQYNSYSKNDNNITITQTIPFSAFGSQASYNRGATRLQESQTRVIENEIALQVRETYIDLVHALEMEKLLEQQDSIFGGFERSATRRYETGESNLLEQSTARSQRNQSKVQLQQNKATVIRLRERLDYLVNAPVEAVASELIPLQLPVLDTAAFMSNPEMSYRQEQVAFKRKEERLEKAKFGPDLLLGYFNQSLIGTIDPEGGAAATRAERFHGIQVGLAWPLWFGPQSARVRSATANVSSATNDALYATQSIRSELRQTIQQIRTHRSNLDYFAESGLPNAELILQQSQIAFREGEISYAEYLLGIRNALELKVSYLNTIRDYNRSIVYYRFLTGEK